MSPRRFRRIDRLAAERLLDGQPVRGSEALHHLLAAAAAPPPGGESPGEHAAVAAFRAAHLAPDPHHGRRPVLKTTLATLLTAKILIPTAAAAAVGGIAVAAATGTLPTPGSHTPTDRPATSQTHLSTPPPGTTSAPRSQTASPDPSLAGLCHAYTAGTGTEHGTALDNPAFTVLVTTAGGKDKVAGYCATLLTDKPGNPATPPSNAHPTDTPQTPDPTHPTGKPTDLPNNPHVTTPPHPTGSPTAVPPTH